MRVLLEKFAQEEDISLEPENVGQMLRGKEYNHVLLKSFHAPSLPFSGKRKESTKWVLA